MSEAKFERALELLELTIENAPKKTYLKELTRTKEVISDFSMGDNIYKSTPKSLKKFFYYFNFRVRKAT